jgi:DNA-binding beta-propeller fold protein YncE
MRYRGYDSTSTAGALILCISFALLFKPPAFAEDDQRPSFRTKYFFTIDARTTGKTFGAVTSLRIDESARELYILDPTNDRVVIADLEGIVLHTFTLYRRVYPTDIAVDAKGRLFVAGEKRVAVFDYKGVFEEYLDLSGVPDSDNLLIQSIVVGREGRIYLGIGGKGRIITLDSEGKFISQIEAKGRFINVRGLTVNDEFTFLDPGHIQVYRLDREGKMVLSFGRDKNGRIYVTDNNRRALILFDDEGNPIWEFGGPRIFASPSRLAVTEGGMIFVADRTKIRAFEIIEEVPASSETP